MSKALVIKGANFAANKVTTVELDDVVPCTGVSLSQNTITFTSIGSTVQLTATKTPLDTTDALTWQSSDTDVATVVNGLVTCTGVGSATITVTCGTQSATCTVSATAVIVITSEYTHESGINYSGSIELPTKDWIGTSSYTNMQLFYSLEDDLGGYRAFQDAANAGKYLIPLPKGATHVIASTTQVTGQWKVRLILADSQTKSQASGSDGKCAAAVHEPYGILGVSTDISDTTANGFVVFVDYNGTITQDVTITFS